MDLRSSHGALSYAMSYLFIYPLSFELSSTTCAECHLSLFSTWHSGIVLIARDERKRLMRTPPPPKVLIHPPTPPLAPTRQDLSYECQGMKSPIKLFRRGFLQLPFHMGEYVGWRLAPPPPTHTHALAQLLWLPSSSTPELICIAAAE